MSDLVKQIASLFPGPVNTARYMQRSGLDVIFPFYHAVSEISLPHMVNLYPIRTPREFESDLEYMLKYFEAVSMSDYLSGSVKVNKDKPPMILSFDDGLVQCYDELMPILKSRSVPATFFLNNAFIDNKDLFYRFKVSLLLEQVENISPAAKEKAAKILHCSVPEINKRLISVSYVEREIADQVADLWKYSFEDYTRMNPVYLTSIQIIKMIDHGYEFGSHGIDHPMFSLLTKETALDHIRSSVDNLQHRFNLDYKYFAFPFTDYGVHDETINLLFENGVIDAGFGTAGLKDDKWPNYYQRLPMEMIGSSAKKTLQGELNRRRLRMLFGKNHTKR